MIRPLSQSVKDFIKKHIDDDVSSLALKSHGSFDIPMAFIFDQIRARQKAKTKLPSFASNFELILPPPLSIEQASSEQTASAKADLIGEGLKLLDLTGGMGIDSYFFSKKNEVTYVEQNSTIYETAAFNFTALGAPDIKTFNESAQNFLSDQTADSFDIIYLDPARRDSTGGRVFGLQESEPDVIRLWDELQRVGKQIIIKASPMLDIDLAKKDLPSLSSVNVLVVRNECKEILLSTKPLLQTDHLVLHLTPTGQDLFEYNTRMAASFNLSKPQKFLYEPNVGIMKLKPFGVLAERFQVSKLHRNSHLFTSEELVADFPGRIFAIEDVIKVDRKSAATYATEGKMNVTTRNFPLTVEQLRIKLKLKDGGEVYCFATTLKSEEKRLIICSKVHMD